MNTLANIEIARTFYFDILYIFVWNCNIHADMLKDLLKNAGLIVILAGVIILGIVVFKGVQTNSTLAVSLVLVIVGLLAHIVINKIVD
jgi:uncharacterized protein YjeT (DUF2065 family)